ncbi:hypothetical protein SCHPADRAFT_569215 [Schizopora paradoxa]|uniref:Uncharacterized protein n=1 Tax=Schizopora paradoxa TaxID=27342 RepID=A0A0H2RCW7_9AGAM|nr:hypothetical protein SCHPADRAFT_569215 [Schizopora paradoxa]
MKAAMTTTTSLTQHAARRFSLTFPPFLTLCSIEVEVDVDVDVNFRINPSDAIRERTDASVIFVVHAPGRPHHNPTPSTQRCSQRRGLGSGRTDRRSQTRHVGFVSELRVAAEETYGRFGEREVKLLSDTYGEDLAGKVVVFE